MNVVSQSTGRKETMATVGEIRKAWTVAKAAVGGIKAMRSNQQKPRGGYGYFCRGGGVAIWPDCLEVFTPTESFTVRIALGIGPVRISADAFAELVKLGKPSDGVRVALSNRGLRGRHYLYWNGARIAAQDSAPQLPEVECGASGRFGPYPGESVKGAALFAAKGDMRPVLNTVAFRNDEIVATDSYRMSRESVAAANLPGDDPVLIPARPLAAIGAKSKEVAVANDGERVSVVGTVAGNLVEWTGQPVSGSFPNYDELFPEDWAIGAELTDNAAEAVKAVTSSAVAVLSVNGAVEVSGESGSVSLSPVTVSGPVEWEDGAPEEPVRIGANPSYLLDAVKYLSNNGPVRYRAISPLRPMLMDSGSRQVLLMPVKLDD